MTSVTVSRFHEDGASLEGMQPAKFMDTMVKDSDERTRESRLLVGVVLAAGDSSLACSLPCCSWGLWELLIIARKLKIVRLKRIVVKARKQKGLELMSIAPCCGKLTLDLPRLALSNAVAGGICGQRCL
jgi:hypothetical protein